VWNFGTKRVTSGRDDEERMIDVEGRIVSTYIVIRENFHNPELGILAYSS
jgi:hypothetical protein